MTIQKIYLGYWYQRTTLHLSEIYDFLNEGKSPLALDKGKLKELQGQLNIDSLEYKVDVLEHIDIHAIGSITIKIYEDGLVVLAKDHRAIKQDIEALTEYFEKRFSPAIKYLFSLGAPVPKELAGIKDAFPYFIVTHHAKKSEMAELLGDLSQDKYLDMSSGDVEILRGHEYFVLNPDADFKNLDGLIEMLIFFKEFKAQLHHYLNLHRTIWDKIAKIKEQGAIRGKDIQSQRSQLESYKKTIELIGGRINQMGMYMGARENIIKTHGWAEFLTNVLQFKYDNLQHSLDYVKSLWTMTNQYVDSAIQVFNEINALSTKNSVQALTVITSLGIVNTVISFLGTEQYPQLTITGIYYFLLLVLGTWALNKLITYIYQTINYKINDIKIAKNIK